MDETKQKELYTEAEISMILDTYMYLNYQGAEDGTSLRSILKELETKPECGSGGKYAGEYSILSEAVKQDAIGTMKVGHQSSQRGYDAGTNACTFISDNSDTVYVVYRGTADGEWPDNGIGMTAESTLQQKRALQYFEEVVEDMGIRKEQRLIITGHSKGGNKAQFVTMETRYADSIDNCYSVDGQGFSEAAIHKWKNKYSEREYQSRASKIRGIHGENDFVSVLGTSIIPAGQILYIKTPVDISNAAGYHDIKYMFASTKTDSATGKTYTEWKGRKNCYAAERGTLGNSAFELYANMLRLPLNNRAGCAAAVMQLIELSGNRKTGLNGETVGKKEILDLILYGGSTVGASLLTGKEGRNLVFALQNKKSMDRSIPDTLYLKISYAGINKHKNLLKSMADRLLLLSNNVSEAAEIIPRYMNNGLIICKKLQSEAERMKEEVNHIKILVLHMDQIIKFYYLTDLEVSDGNTCLQL